MGTIRKLSSPFETLGFASVCRSPLHSNTSCIRILHNRQPGLGRRPVGHSTGARHNALAEIRDSRSDWRTNETRSRPANLVRYSAANLGEQSRSVEMWGLTRYSRSTVSSLNLEHAHSQTLPLRNSGHSPNTETSNQNSRMIEIMNWKATRRIRTLIHKNETIPPPLPPPPLRGRGARTRMFPTMTGTPPSHEVPLAWWVTPAHFRPPLSHEGGRYTSFVLRGKSTLKKHVRPT